MPRLSLKRVAFDAHVLDGKPQGSATFVANILRSIAKHQTSFHLVVYCANPNHARDLIGDSAFEYREIPDSNAASKLIWLLPRLFSKDRIDLGIFQAIAPPFGSVPSLVVMHDLLPFTHPELFPFGFRISRQLLFRHSMRRAVRVAAVSETTKAEIKRLFPDLENKCLIATNGPSFDLHEYFDANTRAHASPLNPNEKYILVVGRIEKRKNVDLLVNAFLRARPEGVKLVIVGKRDLGYSWLPPTTDEIIHLQNLPNNELLNLYRNAALFVYPSSAEGFGIPLLDALLAGAPTISSNQTAMPEIASGLAKFFDPTGASAISQLTDMIASHFSVTPIIAPTMDQRVELSKRYDWTRSAANLIEAINLMCC